jgi:hypothetical protein
MLTHQRKTMAMPGESARDLTQLIAAEYTEMPGLSLTLSQAQRLWAVDRRTCEAVVDALIARGVLRMTEQGRLIRA